MRFASISWPSIPPAAMRIVVETVAVWAKAAIDASLPKKSRSPIHNRHGLRGRSWTHSLLTMPNYLIDNKAGIIIDAVGTRANRAVEIAVTQTMVDRVERRFDLRPLILCGRYGLWRGQAAQMVGGSQHHAARTGVGQVGPPRWHLQPFRLHLRSGAQHLCLPRWRGTDQHRQYRSRSHRLLQGQQERLLALFIEAEVHDGDRAQNYPRS